MVVDGAGGDDIGRGDVFVKRYCMGGRDEDVMDVFGGREERETASMRL